MPNIKLIDAEIEPYTKRQGDYNLAEKLIVENKANNREIAQRSGVSLPRIPQLRRSIRLRARGCVQ